MKSHWIPCRKPARLLLVLSSAFLLFTAGQVWTQDANPGYVATLRLEKPRYLLGETLRFWVGMRSTNGRPIPEEVINRPCTLFIAKPDGSTDTQTVGPAPDRILGATVSEGGMGLGDKIQPGKYVLVWECSGHKTKPVELFVEKNEIFGQVRTEFRFERAGTIKMGTSLPVTLRVENNSLYTIRFPERGVDGAEISVGAIRENPSSYNMTFYPAEKLSPSTISASTYTWDVAAEIPTVVLKPGEHFEQKFLFEDAYKFDQPGKYKVMFSTVLQVLVGEKNGPFAQVCPLRFPASVVEQLVVVK